MTAVEIAAAVFGVHPGVAGADPSLPDVIGEIASGSASSQPQAVDGPTGSSLGLGTGSGYSGSGGGGGASSGSSLGMNPAHGSHPGRAVTATPESIEIAPPAPPPAPIAVTPAAGTLGETLGLQPGSVLPACAGSAVVGSAAIGLGLLTGSGLGSGLVGPGFILGSSGLVGTGSSGAGSVMFGSAVTGSALLTCMLLLPVPELAPSTPLGFPSPPVVVPAAAPVIPPEPVPPAPVQPAPPAPVVIKPPPPHQVPVAAAPTPLSANFNTMEIMTVMILTILGAARAKTSKSRRI
ncbi:hypothetical protein [Nocardia sp. NBC_01327]|uniref:hypothetical protein n=1 Tax=Nocardia sp. NBC_01327 TaxID=2903593 RepID=UPI002E0FFD52|nr:hypothetical protein OG326_33450 [Nocardia sp. NBC_01327]